MSQSLKKAKIEQELAINSNDHTIQKLKLGIIAFRNAFEGITKRIQCQAITKLIAQVGMKNIKLQKLKMIAKFAQRSVKEKKQLTFNRLKIQRIHRTINMKAINSLSMIMRRITKSNLLFSLNKLKGNESNVNQSSIGENKKPLKSSLKSARQSSSSNIFSVSEDSLQNSRSIIFDQGQPFTQAQVQGIRRQNEELKRMILSEEFRQSLMKLQRFDRYIYNIQSEKILKEPIAIELKRLQKMKNEIKGMRSKFYDNQLTVTCLFNHVKLVSEMNRELIESNGLKLKIAEMESKVAEVNSQHRKQIAQYKRKLLFFDVGSKDRSQGRASQSTEPKSGTQVESKGQQFNNDELTTYNIIMLALKNKKYKDVKREIDHFIKKSKKQTFIAIFKQIVTLMEDRQSSSEQYKNLQKSKLQITNNLAQFDKFLRSEKTDELQKIKNKCKAQSTSIELQQLFESVISLHSEIKKLRKKESTSAEKDVRSAQTQKMRRNIENQNEQLKRQLKNMEIRLTDLEEEKQKLSQNIKKNQKVKPGLPPRRPISAQKQILPQVDNQSQTIKKYQQSQLKLKRQIEQLNKQISQNQEKYQLSQQKVESKLSKLQEEFTKLKSDQKQLKLGMRQYESGVRCFTIIKQKKNEKQNYLRDINEFKRVYPQSIFYQLFTIVYSQQQSSQSILNQLRNISSLFSENAWKRKTNFVIKQQTEIGNALNNLIQILFNVHQQRQEQTKFIDDMKKKQTNWNNENTKIKEQNLRWKEDIGRLKEEISKNKQLITKLREQNVSLSQSLKSKSPQKLIRQNSQTSALNNENQRLRSQIQAIKNKLTEQKTITQSLQTKRENSKQLRNQQEKEKAKQLIDFTKTYEIIIAKKMKKVSYQRQLNELKSKYPSSILINLLQNQLQQQSSQVSLINNMKQIINLFTQDKWKRQTNLLAKEQNEIHIYLNQIIELMISISKEKEELQKSVNELSPLRSTIDTITEEIIQLKNQLEKLNRENINMSSQNITLKSQLKEQNQINNSNQLPNTKIKEESIKDKQIYSLREEIHRHIFEKKQAQMAIQGLKTQIQILKEQLKHRNSENFYHQQLNLQQNNIKFQDQGIQIQGKPGHQQKMSEYQSRLYHTEEKLANYKYLFEKTKKQRDNLKLLIEQKNQQYELCKQNQQKYEEIKRLSEQKIIELRYSYESNELQIRKIQNEIERLLEEREIMIAEKQSFEVRMNELIQLKDQQIQELKRLLDDQINGYKLLQHQITHLQKKSQLEIMNMQQEKNYLTKCLQIAEEQINKNRIKYQAQLQDYKNKCDRYTIELQQSKQDFTVQRQILRRKMNQYTQISEYLPINKPQQDPEKQQLRRQIDLLNEQLANILRSNQNQKRQTRKYVQQLINDAQMQSSLYNQQKRILRQDIERARSEEYAINQQKIRKLREDIQSLRSQNERLTSIIDENQTSFNQLVNEHKEMHHGIVELQQHNNHLQQAISLSQQEKQQLLQRLQELQEKLADFENKIVFAMNEGQMKEQQQMKKSQSIIAQLQAKIHFLTQQRTHLILKHSEQARQLIQMQSQLIRLEAETNNYKQTEKEMTIVSKTKVNDYSKYLEEKIQFYESQVKIFTKKQQEMMKKIQTLIKNINQQQIQKQQYLSKVRNQDSKFNLINSDFQRQLHNTSLKLSQLESIVKDKDEQISSLKNQFNNQNNQEFQPRVYELESTNHKLTLQNYRLKTIVEEYSRSKLVFEQKIEQTQKITLENKRLTNKIIMIEEASKLIESKYLQCQTEIHALQSRLNENIFSQTLTNHGSALNKVDASKNLKEELNWCKEQLKQRQEQLNQLRIKQLHMQASLKRSEETIAQLNIKQERYYRESYLLEDNKARLREVQQQLTYQRSTRRTMQEDYILQISEKDQQLILLQNANVQINEQNYKLSQKLAAQNKYENQFLFQIAKQLDQNYEIEGQEQEIQIRILQKISTQIGQLIQMNTLFKQKCEVYQKRIDQNEGYSQISLIASIRYMLHDFITYLSNHQMINPQQIPSIPQETNAEKLISEIGPLLKELFSNSIKNNEEQIKKYNEMIQDIKASIDQFYNSSSLQSLNKLKNLINTN